MINQNIKTKVGLWLPVVLWAAVIFMFSSLPSSRNPHFDVYDFVVKKTAHMVEYLILSVFIYRALFNSGFDKKRSGIFAILLSIFYALTDEFHQSFTPGRTPAFRDIVFDTIGGSVAVLFIWKLLPIMPQRLKSLGERLRVL